MRRRVLPLIGLAVASAGPVLSQIPNDVAMTPDIVYATYGDRSLKLDLFLPKEKPPGPLPGIVVIRGGGWRQGDKLGFRPIAVQLAAAGFATACIEYRVLPDATMMDAVHDTKAAVRWMRAEGGRYGIDPDAIGAIGGSAGGHLVALLGTSYKEPMLEGNGGHAGVSSRVQAVAPMAPVVDFASMANRPELGSGAVLKIFSEHREWAKRLSPVTYLDRDSAPMLLIHSNADKSVPYAQSLEMMERSKQAGVRAELVTIDGAPHPFWNLPKWSGDTIQKSARFFHSTLDRVAARR